MKVILAIWTQLMVSDIRAHGIVCARQRTIFRNCHPFAIESECIRMSTEYLIVIKQGAVITGIDYYRSRRTLD